MSSDFSFGYLDHFILKQYSLHTHNFANIQLSVFKKIHNFALSILHHVHNFIFPQCQQLKVFIDDVSSIKIDTFSFMN